MLGGTGLGFSFVPVTIASLAGVERADAGVASGLVNTSRQIGGAIGLAAISTIAASATTGYANSHGSRVTNAAATVNGFQTAFVVLGGLLVAAFVVAAVFLRPARERVEEWSRRAAGGGVSARDDRRQRQRIDELLREIDAQRQQQLLLEAAGAYAPGLEQEARQTRERWQS